MGSIQCNVQFGYQLSIFPDAKENHITLSWPVAGPSIISLSLDLLPFILNYGERDQAVPQSTRNDFFPFTCSTVFVNLFGLLTKQCSLL
jgi:hypothetical protein